MDQTDSVAHLWGALDILHAERIDHGIHVLDDALLVAAVRDRHVGLTVAPTLYYREIPGRMEYRAGAMKKLLELGVLVTVNSDDPGMKRSLYVSDLMLRAQQTVDLSRDQLIQLARNSFTIAWIDAPQRQQYEAALDAYVARRSR